MPDSHRRRSAAVVVTPPWVLSGEPRARPGVTARTAEATIGSGWHGSVSAEPMMSSVTSTVRAGALKDL